MKRRRLSGRSGVWISAVLLVLFAVSAVFAQQAKLSDAQRGRRAETMSRLVGTWVLASRVVRLENGTSVNDPGLGGTPVGYLVYDAAGHVAVQLMRRNRGVGIDCSTSGSTTGDNNSQSINGFDAYFGTYTIDETNHTVTHHLEGALAVSDVGKDLVRGFHLSGNKLTLLVNSQSPQGKQTIALTWERVH